jgi:hypothetical protein
MNLLYFGKYRARFHPIIEHLKKLPAGAHVVELCFGDTYIADCCKKAGLMWAGFDMNDQFVRHAQKAGHQAVFQDLSLSMALPKADICIMIGSFYHFYQEAGTMLSKMFQVADTVVISEPVLTFSNSGGLVGLLAKRSANAGRGAEKFRYNQSSFLTMLREHESTVKYKIVSQLAHGKDLIVTLQKGKG